MSSKLMIIAGAMTLAAVACAQDAPYGPVQGAKTFSVLGSYSSTKVKGSSDLKVTLLSLSGSYFFTNSIEATLGLVYANADSGDSVSLDALRIGGRYYLNGNKELSMESPLVPFVGVNFSTAKVTSIDRANGFGVEVGAQYFLQPNVSLTPTISWNRLRTEGEDIDTTALGFGLTVWFK